MLYKVCHWHGALANVEIDILQGLGSRPCKSVVVRARARGLDSPSAAMRSARNERGECDGAYGDKEDRWHWQPRKPLRSGRERLPRHSDLSDRLCRCLGRSRSGRCGCAIEARNAELESKVDSRFGALESAASKKCGHLRTCRGRFGATLGLSIHVRHACCKLAPSVHDFIGEQ